jgi:hypothetical protein
MKKRIKPQKRMRKKVERLVARERLMAGRVHRVKPNPNEPYIVEVRLARDRLRMRQLMSYHDGPELDAEVERECGGLVRTWYGKRTKTPGLVRPRFMVARMYLNVKDLQDRPSEIVAHECTHAAMGYARLKRAHLGYMHGEEVLAYAVGHLTREVNNVCYAAGVWR